MKKLLSIEEVTSKILDGERLILAADEKLLDLLPKGNWIGGTIPYFMSDDGGVFTKEKIYTDELPAYAIDTIIKFYDTTSITGITSDEFDNGYTMLIIPAFSQLHTDFAENSHKYKDIFNHPLIGWISGTDLSAMEYTSPKTYNGSLGEKSDSKAVAMHIKLPQNKIPSVDMINIFKQGEEDSIRFSTTGFNASECLINGQKVNLAEYLTEKKIDSKLPLVADYYGAMVNTSIQNIDLEKKRVSFFAPVFPELEYRIATPIEDYISEFNDIIDQLNIKPVHTCNCILNYLYAGLQGKKTASLTGPMTFGEIAYQLLNQTLVYLKIDEI
ncbi:MAG: hypothetical protein Q8940_20655 [Bacteroidota bacterium]|nr:hypothetical protein [Bacteroidota bacterium]